MRLTRRQLRRLMSEAYKDYEIKKRMDRLRSVKDSGLLRKINAIDPEGSSIADKKQARSIAQALGSIEDDSPFLDIKLEPIEKYMFLLYYSFMYAYLVGYSKMPFDPISKKDLFKTAGLVLKIKPSAGSLGVIRFPKDTNRLESAFKKMISEKHIITTTSTSGQPMYTFNMAMNSLQPYK